jgi:hypothetical protein
MNGAHFAKKYVNDYLKIDIPTRLVDYQNGWAIDNQQLPEPEQYIIHEPLALDRWPSIITTVLTTNELERIGFDNGDPLYRVSYSMRTYVWVRTEGSEECTLMRDRMTTVVRSALLDYPCLRAYDSRTSFRALIDESTIREEFSDITLLKGDRVMAGAYVSYTLQIDEVVMRKDHARVEEIEFDTSSVGAGIDMPNLNNPALDNRITLTGTNNGVTITGPGV